MNDELMRAAFRNAKTIAVVGLSDKPHRASYRIAHYLQQQGYRIVPVNPNVEQVLGEQAYPDLASVPGTVDFVDIFRRSEYVGPIVDQAIAKGVQTIWMQMGVSDRIAAGRAEAAGITVVMNRCAMVDHGRLMRDMG
jgi:predicted CoA-binding protein